MNIQAGKSEKKKTTEEGNQLEKDHSAFAIPC